MTKAPRTLFVSALVLAGVAALCVSAATLVRAQTAPAAAPVIAAPAPMTSEIPAPEASSPGYIALLYYRLTGEKPDFEAWAMASDDYIAANSFDKDLVKREKAVEAERAFHLVTFDEPLVMERQVTLSSYSRAKRGFFVEDFRPDTFFSSSFIGRNYAVVPLDLMDFQWVSVDDVKVQRELEDIVRANGGKARIYVYVTPNFADKQTPLKINNKEYWLLSGRVQRLQIYDHRGKRMLWEGFGKNHVEQQQQEVLDLYK